MLKHKLLFTALTIALLPIAARGVSAEEYIITDNGSGSDNEINVTSSNTTIVNQTNTAEVQNNVDIEANTGENTANANTGGDTSITTGNVDASTAIQNNLNTSVAKVENCNCDTSGTIKISGNGAYSDNSVNNSTSTTNSVQVNQYASINNNVNGYTNTGGNTANYNTNGDISINTGDITVEEKIKNNVNKAKVKLLTNPLGGYLIDIFGNGAYSDNRIEVDEDNENILSVNNVADIYNNSFWDLITGNNKANGNTDGDVNIKTGDIKLATTIENNVNESKVVVDCDCEEEKPEKPEEEKPEEEKPSQPPVTGGNGGNGQNGEHKKDGEVLAAAIGEILPITGTPWFVLAILGNILMLLFGTVLRLRSGRSPGLAYAI